MQAMDLARDTLEELRGKVDGSNWPEGNLSAAGNPHNTEGFLSMANYELGYEFGGTREYTVTNIDASNAIDSDGDTDFTNDIDYKAVTVTVQWNEP